MESKPSTTSRGREAEDQAADFLRALGFTIITRRFKRAGGEIDIIALDDEILVFVEVKSRKAGGATEALSERKSSRIQRVAASYLAEMGLHEKPHRFDLVTVEAGKITHFREFIEL